MSEDMEKYSQQLRHLVDEYYQQQISAEVYHEQRKLILDKIEVEFSTGSQGSVTPVVASLDE